MSDDIIERLQSWRLSPDTPTRFVGLFRESEARIAELEAENEKWKFELDDYDQYTMCDCCEALHTGCVDAEGHMQCPSCCRIAELEAENERMRQERDRAIDGMTAVSCKALDMLAGEQAE